MSDAVVFVEVDAIESVYHDAPWGFARERAADIAAHWARLTAEKPAMFDGRVLLIDRWSVETRGGRRVLATRHFSTDYSAFLAWRDFG
ncbi:MAG TPA: NUDIX hydrolase, partial [Beijerinckiaceae bacterium]